MPTKKKKLDLRTITTEPEATRALRALGFVRAKMNLTRGAKTYEHATLGWRFQVSTAPGGFIITGGVWTFMSAALSIGNLKDGAQEKLDAMLSTMNLFGILEGDDPVPLWGVCVGIAASALEEARIKAARAAPVPA